MGLTFAFATAGVVRFGVGQSQALSEHLHEVLSTEVLRGPCLIVTGSRPERARFVVEQLKLEKVEYDFIQVNGEPEIADAEDATRRGRALGAQFVIACGGGSAIDLGKAVAALVPNPGAPLDYLEVIGRGEPLARPALPVVALPTTAGTGAEVTKNAVLSSPEHRVKVSLRHASMLPRLAIVDPELTCSVPAATTAATGLDALTQCIEPFLSSLANPLTDGIAREGIVRGSLGIRGAVRDGSDIEARTNMALCSLMGGLALANSKLGAVHGLAGVLGGMVQCPHGAVCARLLAPTLLCNLRALEARAPTHPALLRFDELAKLVTGDPRSSALLGIEWLGRLVEELDIPRLGDVGLVAQDVDRLLEGAARSSSMKGNPLQLTESEMRWIVEQSF